jgi:anti-sigma-K factor RskA
MSQNDKTEPRDLSLWHRYRGGGQGLSGSPATPDPLDSVTLAAYLDGTLSEAERERIESRLAHSPDDLELVLAARDALADDEGPAPDPFVARACALVPETPGGGTLGRMAKSVLGPDGAGGRFWQPFAWSSAAAAVLLACTLGFQLGQSGYASVLSVEQFQSRQVGAVLGQPAEDFL